MKIKTIHFFKLYYIFKLLIKHFFLDFLKYLSKFSIRFFSFPALRFTKSLGVMVILIYKYILYHHFINQCSWCMIDGINCKTFLSFCDFGNFWNPIAIKLLINSKEIFLKQKTQKMKFSLEFRLKIIPFVIIDIFWHHDTICKTTDNVFFK